MRSQHTEGIDVISRSGKSNRKFTSRTNIDWSWFGKVKSLFLAMSPPQSGHPCVPKLTSICVISCRTLWQENNNPRTFGFSFDIFAVKGLYQKLPFLLLCFRPKMKKKTKNEMVQVFWFLIEVRLAKRTQNDC